MSLGNILQIHLGNVSTSVAQCSTK